ncbi:hypothetical protein FQA39_LY00616 [Lamprigera yunnana]|nr:hypothetical protein FQA39_LY00616 [Lamprigera yunnana]
MKPLFTIFRRFVGTIELKKLLRESKCSFDGNLKKMIILEACDGSCVAELKIEGEQLNSQKFAHTGLIATAVDVMTTYAMYTHKSCLQKPTASVDIFVSYMSRIPCGDTIVLCADTKRINGKFVFATCAITKKGTDELLAMGQHTKYIMSK